MKPVIECLIIVSVFIPSLIGFDKKFGPSIYGAIHEKIDDKERVDHYNQVALDHLKSKDDWKGSNLTILSTTESICDNIHYVKVAILAQKKSKKKLVRILLDYAGKIGPHSGILSSDFPYLFDRSDKAATERNSKIVLDHLKEKDGFKNEKLIPLVLETYTKEGEKEYYVLLYSLDKKQKQVLKAGGLVSENGTLSNSGIAKDPPREECFVK